MTGEAKLLEQMLDAVLLSADLLALREDDVLQSLNIIRERGSGTGHAPLYRMPRAEGLEL